LNSGSGIKRLPGSNDKFTYLGGASIHANLNQTIDEKAE